MSIQLKDFIRETLIQITHGVREAQEQLAETGAIISPRSIEPSPDDPKVFGFLCPKEQAGISFRPIVHLVKFDVAVLATEKSESGGKVGVSVLSLSADFGGGSHGNKTSESRIQFNIPVVLPTTDRQYGQSG